MVLSTGYSPMDSDRTMLSIRQCKNGYIVYLPPPKPEYEGPPSNYAGFADAMKEVVRYQRQSDLEFPEQDEEPGTEKIDKPKKRKSFEFEIMNNVYIFTTLEGLLDFLKLTLI